MAIELAPYKVLRHFDGVEVHWFVVNTLAAKDISSVVDHFECRQDAADECSRRNSTHAMDTIGIY
jgi:hypothetical protein